MLDPDSLYELEGEVATPPQPSGAVLLHALDGFLDAGSAGRLAVEHLIGTLDGDVVARFDVDQLFDYRARRPGLLFIEDHYESYDAPELVLRAMHDAEDKPFLLLSGPEPDVQWERFAAAVVGLVVRYDASLAMGLGAVPMTVPHTRPTTLTTHATRKDLVTRPNVWRGRIRVPASISALLELRLGDAGRDAMGYVAHVPHYLSALEYPGASVALLDAVSARTGLVLPVDALQEVATQRRVEVDAQIADDEQARELVAALETQYDAFVDSEQRDLVDPGTPLPTGEELGAELERFLAQVDRRDDERG